MRVGIVRFALLLVAAVWAAGAAPAAAEFVCSSDVSFSWAKAVTPVPTPSDEAAGVARQAGKGGPSHTPAATSPAPIVVRVAGVQRFGLDEAGAKANLEIEVNRQKTRAAESCRRDHESPGDCLATKLASRASTLNSLGFSARAELEKALRTECFEQQGTCLGAESSPPQCREYARLKPQEAGGAASAGKKNEPKKPETKKK